MFVWMHQTIAFEEEFLMAMFSSDLQHVQENEQEDSLAELRMNPSIS